MSHSLGIAGAGLLGRMLALAFHRKGWHVTMYDRGPRAGAAPTSRLSTGLIAPYVELTADTQAVTLLGEYATEQWPAWIESLSSPVCFRENGVLAVAHPRDAGELEALHQRVAGLAAHDDLMTDCTASDIAQLEPELAGRFHRALFFPLEQHLDPCSLLHALAHAVELEGITWHEHTEVTSVAPHSVTTPCGTETFDWVIDVRGTDAGSRDSGTQAVRSERLRLHAPGVNLSRPVRLMHPRHAIYIIPHDRNRYVIGSIDTMNAPGGHVTARSALELLSAAHTVHAGFGEAVVEEAGAVQRTTLPGGMPRITPSQGLLSINGSSLHAWLVAPALADIAVTFIDTGDTHPMAGGVMEEWTL